MFRTSPYYTNVRQEVYSEINYQLAQELDQMKQYKDPTSSNSKKSASKQNFNSIFYKRTNDQDQILEDQIIKKCSNCEIKIVSDDINCSVCNKLMCQKCINECTGCGNNCCLVCSKYAYLQSGDFLMCLQCIQQQ
ncbi:unnamed protein product (macronuclear) [Paramecium tetraurelia]|uniref:Apoptosis regulatory protein Siva n=1 Tax=Paramecium tetraurelia TaxID=5888 RepID=A0E8M3_PARTE|nr:uncharacterized protein GSPATT00024369001 [Paramecium tetraurelia]CAK91640.1 unnamed protein product [Paramecium tetraurelia]|eukprot:XP_001459037.1 hypothetical protein (macronuclear) [Paramecium tetraurelia strain d4-2]